ncbi:TPA: SGNH/GDSL hydrolase family protein [Burkholderia vietnamiensis]|nr:SGNH/GDSL hydrolase family protein [Burkholderia vietnamiensis]
MGSTLPPFGSPQVQRTNVLRALLSNANAGMTSALAARTVMTTPPTVTANGTNAPAGNTRAYNWNTYPSNFRQFGGTPLMSSSGIRRFQALTVNPTGGNIGNSANPGASGDVWRVEMMVDAVAPSFRVGVVTSTSPYRFIVNDQYVSLTGTPTVSSSGSYEYITLDFTNAGGRAVRKITVEGMANGGFDGCYVGPTESVSACAEGNLLNGVGLGDSYMQGADGTHYGDGLFMRMADYLGIRNFMASGSGGTGWQTAPTTYRFGDRIANGDLSLNGTPDIIFLMGSYNDRNAATQAAIQTPALAGMQAARSQFPNALIVVIGAYPGSTGPSAGILQAEAAMQAAFAQFADSFSVFVPISPPGFPQGYMVFGTGNTGAPAGNGNADLWIDSGGVHFNNAGCGFGGYAMANRVIAAVVARFGTAPTVIV